MNCSRIEELAPLFLSGEIDAELHAAIRVHAARCPECALHLEQQAWVDDQLRDALATPPPDTTALDRAIWRRIDTPSPRRWLIPAAAAAVLVLSAASWFLPIRPAPPRIYTDAARDHHREVVDRQPRRWRSTAAEIDAVAARQGFSAAEALALAPAGYRLEHAKICGLAGKPVLHLVYTDGAREFSLYLLHAQAGRQAVEVGAENIESFEGSRFTALAVTDASAAECRQFAAALAGKRL